MESFATIVHGLYLLIIDTKLSILGVCGSPVCVSIQCKKTEVEKGKWTIFCVMFFFSLLKWQYFDDDDDDACHIAALRHCQWHITYMII